jgi:hypothetical protein
LVNLAFAWRRDAHHRFVGFDVDNFLIIRDLVARFYFDIDNGGFGDRFAELRHNNWDLRHGILILEAEREPFARSLLRWVDGQTKDLDDKESVCLWH